MRVFGRHQSPSLRLGSSVAINRKSQVLMRYAAECIVLHRDGVVSIRRGLLRLCVRYYHDDEITVVVDDD